MTSITKILSTLINFNSTIDTGDTIACAEYAGDILSSCGVKNKIVSFPKGKNSLIAIIEGKSKKTIALHAHLDTAPYYKELSWRFPADSVSLKRNLICGRGAVDCKSQAAVWIKIMCEAAQMLSGAEKSLMLVLSCDEEADGAEGLKRLIAEGYISAYTGSLNNIELVIGEGGGFPVPFKNGLLYTFQTGEYESVNFEEENSEKGSFKAGNSEENIASEKEGPSKDECGGKTEICRRKLTDKELSVLETAIKKGYYTELIYEYIADCGTEKRRLDTEALYKGMAGYFERAEETLTYKKYGRLFETALRKEVPNAGLFPVVTPGFSDNRYFRRAGIPVIGFFPFYEKDHIIMHGANEYVSTNTLELSYKVVYDIVKELIMKRS